MEHLGFGELACERKIGGEGQASASSQVESSGKGENVTRSDWID